MEAAVQRRFLTFFNTTPGTIADDLGCLAALIMLAAVAYGLLVLA